MELFENITFICFFLNHSLCSEIASFQPCIAIIVRQQPALSHTSGNSTTMKLKTYCNFLENLTILQHNKKIQVGLHAKITQITLH